MIAVPAPVSQQGDLRPTTPVIGERPVLGMGLHWTAACRRVQSAWRRQVVDDLHALTIRFFDDLLLEATRTRDIQQVVLFKPAEIFNIWP